MYIGWYRDEVTCTVSDKYPSDSEYSNTSSVEISYHDMYCAEYVATIGSKFYPLPPIVADFTKRISCVI